MDAGYYVLSFVTTLCTSAISVYLCRAFFRPSGWTKKDNNGVAVRFKVFLPLYLQKPEKWKLMPDKAEYDNMMTVYFSSGIEWRKYNRWQKKAEKERQKRQQEERKQRFYEMIFKDYQTEPNPEFIPPPTVKPKTKKDKPTIIRRELQGRSAVTNLYYGICETVDDLKSEEAGRWAKKSSIYCVATDKLYVKGSGGEWREAVEEPKTAENGEDCFIVNGGVGNPIVAVIPKPKDGLTNAEIDKIRTDLLFSQYSPENIDTMIKQWADSKDWGINPMELAVQAAIEKYKEGKQNPRCKDCYYMIWKPNGDKFETVCCKDLKESGYCDHIHPEMTACNRYKSGSEYGSREVRDYAKWAAARDAILHSVKTEQIPTSEHYE